VHALLLTILSFCPATLAQRDSYTVCYDTHNQRPLWTIHTIAPATTPAARKHWRKDHQLNSLPSSAFTNTGFDRGHLTPAADVPASEDAYLTSNAIAQNPALNRGQWRRLENRLRQHTGATIVTGAIYANCGNETIEAPCLLFKVAFLPNGELIAALHLNAPKIPH